MRADCCWQDGDGRAVWPVLVLPPQPAISSKAARTSAADLIVAVIRLTSSGAGRRSPRRAAGCRPSPSCTPPASRGQGPQTGRSDLPQRPRPWPFRLCSSTVAGADAVGEHGRPQPPSAAAGAHLLRSPRPKSWSCREGWSPRHFVKVEITGSSPVRSAKAVQLRGRART